MIERKEQSANPRSVITYDDVGLLLLQGNVNTKGEDDLHSTRLISFVGVNNHKIIIIIQRILYYKVHVTTMSRYLDEYLPHLKALHNSLGLPIAALEDDKTKIDAAIKAVVVSIVRERETEVERWREEIELARKDVVCLGKALGDRTIVKGEGDSKMEQGGEVRLEGSARRKSRLTNRLCLNSMRDY